MAGVADVLLFQPGEVVVVDECPLLGRLGEETITPDRIGVALCAGIRHTAGVIRRQDDPSSLGIRRFRWAARSDHHVGIALVRLLEVRVANLGDVRQVAVHRGCGPTVRGAGGEDVGLRVAHVDGVSRHGNVLPMEQKRGGRKLAPADRVRLVAEPLQRVALWVVGEEQQPVPILETRVGRHQQEPLGTVLDGPREIELRHDHRLACHGAGSDLGHGVRGPRYIGVDHRQVAEREERLGVHVGMTPVVVARHEVVCRVGEVAGRAERLVGAGDGHLDPDLLQAGAHLAVVSPLEVEEEPDHRVNSGRAPLAHVVCVLGLLIEVLQGEHDARLCGVFLGQQGAAAVGVGPCPSQRLSVAVPLDEPAVPAAA